MLVHRGFGHPQLAPACALTIGNFDGVHRGHQAMLALLNSEAKHRGLPSCVMTFEPHPRDYFASRVGRPLDAPARVATLRDKLLELSRCGVDQVIVARFDARLASMPAETFVRDVLVGGLNARYVLVGDDFRFGARRTGDYAMLDALGDVHGFDVARMQSYEVHDARVSSSAVRDALASGNMLQAQALLGRPHALSGRVMHGRKLGRELGFRTMNLKFSAARSAANGIFVAAVHGLSGHALPAVASIGVRPSVEDAGRVLIEAHCLEWPDLLGSEGAYGRCVTVTLVHKLHDEVRYDSMQALHAGIAADVAAAKAWWRSHP